MRGESSTYRLSRLARTDWGRSSKRKSCRRIWTDWTTLVGSESTRCTSGCSADSLGSAVDCFCRPSLFISFLSKQCTRETSWVGSTLESARTPASWSQLTLLRLASLLFKDSDSRLGYLHLRFLGLSGVNQAHLSGIPSWALPSASMIHRYYHNRQRRLMTSWFEHQTSAYHLGHSCPAADQGPPSLKYTQIIK